MTPQNVWFFDIGNTRIKVAARPAGQWELLVDVQTRPLKTLSRRLNAAFRNWDATPAAEEVRWAGSSVCPAATAALKRELQGFGAKEPSLFGDDISIPLTILTEEPQKVGTDRLLCALGARELVGAPCIVIGAGTAITVDVVDAQGRFAGGAIAPGFGLSAKALHRNASLLPEVIPSVPHDPVGRNTEEALRSGIYHFCRGGTAELIRRFTQRSSPGTPVVITGADRELRTDLEIESTVREVQELIFEGMWTALRAE